MESIESILESDYESLLELYGEKLTIGGKNYIGTKTTFQLKKNGKYYLVDMFKQTGLEMAMTKMPPLDSHLANIIQDVVNKAPKHFEPQLVYINPSGLYIAYYDPKTDKTRSFQILYNYKKEGR